MITSDIIVVQTHVLLLHYIFREIMQVVYGSTLGATRMMMGHDFGIESGVRAAQIKLPDSLVSSQQLQIAVNCSQADPGQPFPHNPVQFCCGRMRPKYPQLLKNNLPLPCVPLVLQCFHKISCTRY
jgi:hypothetical protein